MPRKFEQTAVLLVLAASPFWLPSISSRVGTPSRVAVAEWLKPSFEVIGSARHGVGTLFSGLLEWMTVFEENQILRSHLQAFQAREEDRRRLELENDRLRRLLEFKERSPWRVASAEVIGREMGAWSRSLLLDKGRRDGVREGMAVVAPAGLIGRIGDVGLSSSRVILLSDPHFRVTAVFLETRLSGLITGGGVGECLLTYLPLDAQPKEGEKVFTAGGMSFCPEGVPVGVVRKIWIDRSQLFKTARLQPAVDPNAVEEVLIVAESPHPRS